MDNAPTEESRIYLPFLEGMRALAALYVVGHHLWQFAVSSGQVPPKWFQAFSVFKYGTYAVAVFLVISGYCLMLPIARQSVARLERGVGPFAMRRAHRLLPAYFAVLVASILLIAVVPSLRSPSGTPWDITQPNLTFDSIASHVFLIHNWSEELHWSINPPMWSIALELQIYAVFAVVLLPVVRLLGARRMAVLAFALSLALVALGGGFARPWMIGLFSVGVVVAEITVKGRQRSSRDWVWLMTAGFTVVAASGAVEMIDDQVRGSLISEVMVGFATAVTIVVLASRGDTGIGSTGVLTARALSWAPLRAIGRASYSLYLVHYPIVAVIHLTVIKDRGWGIPVSLLVLTTLTAPVIAAVTAGAFYAVERPFLRRPTEHSSHDLAEDHGRSDRGTGRRFVRTKQPTAGESG